MSASRGTCQYGGKTDSSWRGPHRLTEVVPHLLLRPILKSKLGD